MFRFLNLKETTALHYNIFTKPKKLYKTKGYGNIPKNIWMQAKLPQRKEVNALLAINFYLHNIISKFSHKNWRYGLR
jgi:hypothetical protein